MPSCPDEWECELLLTAKKLYGASRSIQPEVQPWVSDKPGQTFHGETGVHGLPVHLSAAACSCTTLTHMDELKRDGGNIVSLRVTLERSSTLSPATGIMRVNWQLRYRGGAQFKHHRQFLSPNTKERRYLLNPYLLHRASTKGPCPGGQAEQHSSLRRLKSIDGGDGEGSGSSTLEDA
ncbi:unnamed protein product [Pleuronectes platessa]|uniref:Uncharacterized protein n=1 Tax=Pleuronectes platessa TaxID=8262 RepID=A0A9N7VMQ9_PLEPL|nr:unnamed protein product [Pleuronectes platessa]